VIPFFSAVFIPVFKLNRFKFNRLVTVHRSGDGGDAGRVDSVRNVYVPLPTLVLAEYPSEPSTSKCGR